MENLFKKNPLQDLLSSLNAVISTNEMTQFITGHMIYNPAYTYKFQLRTTIMVQSPYIHILTLLKNQIKEQTNIAKMQQYTLPPSQPDAWIRQHNFSHLNSCLNIYS